MSSHLFPKPKVIISGKELSAVLPRVSLLDARASLANPHYGNEQHVKKRVSGSFYVDLESRLSLSSSHKGSNHSPSGGGRHPLPPIDDFITWLESVGIGRRPCVCFDDSSNMFAGRLWWMLENLGIEAYLLDGGIYSLFDKSEVPNAEIEEGHPENIRKNADTPFTPPGSSYYSPENNSNNKQWKKIVLLDEVDDIINGKSRKVITDARAPDRFGSSLRPAVGSPDPISSHIPGAVNIPFGSNLTGPPMEQASRLKSEAELKEKFQKLIKDHNVQDESEIVMSCGSGVSTCLNIALMQQFGLGSPDMYVGSWSEYSKKRQDVLVKKQIKEQGFSILFEKANPNVEEKLSVVDDDKLSIVVDDVAFENAKLAIAKNEKEEQDENFAKALAQIRSGEVATIFTAKKSYRVEQK